MASLKPETLYKPLAPNIALWREQGFTDDEINDHVLDTLGRARQAGYTDEDMNAVRSREENPLKQLARGITEGLTLGYYVPDWLKQTPQEVATSSDVLGVPVGLEGAGALAGSLAPFTGALKLTGGVARGTQALLGAGRGGRIAGEAAHVGAASGLMGAAAPGTFEERGQHAATGLALGGALGGASGLVRSIVAGRAAARAPKPPPSEVVASEPEMLALPPGPQPRTALPPRPTKRVYEAGEEGIAERAAPGEPPPRSAPPRPFEEAPGEVVGRRGVPDEDLLIRRPVGEQPRPLQTASERAQRRAGLDPTAPSERPSAILTPGGKPVMVPLRTPKPSPEEQVTRDAEDAVKVALGPGAKRAVLPAKPVPVPEVEPLVPAPVRPDPGTPERVKLTVQAGGKRYTFTRDSRAEIDSLQDQIRQAVPPETSLTFELTPMRAASKAAPIEEPVGLTPSKSAKRGEVVRLPEEVEAPSVAELLDRKGYRFRVDHANPAAPYTLVGPGGQPQRFKKVTDVIAFADTLQDDVRATTTAKAIRGEKLTPKEQGELRKSPKRRKVADQPLSVEADPRLAQQPPDPPPLPPISGAAGGVGLPRPMWVEAIMRTRKLGRVDPETGAFTPNPEGTRFVNAVESVLRTSPELEGPLRASFDRAQAMSWNPLDVIGQPTSALNPLVRKVAQETQRVEMAWDFEQRQWGEYFTKHFAHLTDAESTQAARLVEGRLTAAPSQRVRDAVEAWRVAAQDFAKRLGVPEWAEYLTRLTNFQGVYEQWRPQILSARRFADLPESLQLKIGSDGVFTRMRKAFEKQTEWTQLPHDVRTDIEKRLLTWDVGQRWESLPEFVKARLPKEMFDRFLLPRTGGVPYLNDIRQSFKAYVAPAVRKLHVDPLLDRWGPIVDAMPGRANIPLTEGHYLNRYLDLFTSKESVGGLDRAVDGLVKTVENGLGRALADPNLASRLAARGAAWTYRGALGIDSAIINTTQGINTWAQGGTSGFLRGLGRYVAGQARHRPDVGLLRNIADIYPGGEFIGPGAKPAFSGRLAAIDDKITKLALSPMAVAEHVNRGVAFLSGMEEAAAMGLNSTQAFGAGWARASRVVPNLELTRAQMNAITRVGESQFGYSPAFRSPYIAGPLARLSTIFWSYPTRQAQFVTNGVADGLYSVLTQPSMEAASRLTRYVALLGLMTGGAVMGAKIGVNLERVFGIGNMIPHGFAGPIGLAFQAYNAATAGPTTSAREIGKAWDKGLTILVPQYRTGQKVTDAIQSAQRGYRVDQLGHQTYRTTPYGEFMRALGVEYGNTYRERVAVRSIIEDNAVRLDERRSALHAAIEKNDFRAAEQYNERYPELPLTERDLRAEMKLRLTPKVERVGPLYMRRQALEELGEDEPSDAMGARP